MPTTLGHFRRERERAPTATPVGGRLGGGRGIRTPGAIADTTVFKTVSFGHSDSPPDLPHPTGTGGAMPTARTQAPRTPRENASTQTRGGALPWDRARTCRPHARGGMTSTTQLRPSPPCRAHARGESQAPEARPHRPHARGRYPDTAVSTNDVHTPRVRKGAGPRQVPRARPLSQRR